MRNDREHVAGLQGVVDDRGIPTHIKSQLAEMAEALKIKWACPICLDMIDNGNPRCNQLRPFLLQDVLGRVEESVQGPR